MSKNLMVLIALVMWVGCAADDEQADPDLDHGVDIDDQRPMTPSSIAAPLGYPAPGYHRLDTYCLSDQTLNTSIYFSVDSQGLVESDVLTVGRTLRLINSMGQPVWRLFVQQADRDSNKCVTMFDFAALIQADGTGHVSPGTFRRECFDDRPTATVVDCLALYY